MGAQSESSCHKVQVISYILTQGAYVGNGELWFIYEYDISPDHLSFPWR